MIQRVLSSGHGLVVNMLVIHRLWEVLYQQVFEASPKETGILYPVKTSARKEKTGLVYPFQLEADRIACPGQHACLEIHFRSVLQFATSFHLTRPHGKTKLRNRSHSDRFVQLPFAHGYLR